MLNHSKCEVIGLTPLNQEAWRAAGYNFKECALDDAILLGTPIHAGVGVDQALASKTEDLKLML
jgi:hypothetical protein